MASLPGVNQRAGAMTHLSSAGLSQTPHQEAVEFALFCQRNGAGELPVFSLLRQRFSYADDTFKPLPQQSAGRLLVQTKSLGERLQCHA